jgi:mRNA-degrading endonuclease RelE of RelBE toxin-antitoxin system
MWRPISRVTDSYQVTFSPPVRQQLTRLPARARTLIERKLEDIARSVGMRHWVSPHEAQEEFRLPVGTYELAYMLDPEARTLVVQRLAATEGTPRD